MQPDASGKYPYTGSVDCFVKTVKSGGPFKLYTGFPVYCVRIAPHVMVMSPFPSQFIGFVFDLPFDLNLIIWSIFLGQMTWIFLNQIQKLEKKVGL